MARKKIAILYLLTGIGHFREAYSIKKELESKGCSVDLIDPIEHLKNGTSKRSRMLYALYRFGFQRFLKSMSNQKAFPKRPLDAQRSLNFYAVAWKSALIKKLAFLTGKVISFDFDYEQYDDILSVHFLTTEMVRAAVRKEKWSKIMNIIPDEVGLSAAYAYRIRGIMNAVPSIDVGEKVQTLGVRSSHVVNTGHPLDPALYRNRDVIFSRVQKGLREGKIHVGLYLGVFAPMHQTRQTIQVLEELAPTLRNGHCKATVISYKQQKHEEQVDALVQSFHLEDQVTRLYVKSPEELVVQGHRMMESDINVMFSRPSELTFYSLCLGIPHVMYNALGVQEFDMYAHLRRFADVKLYEGIQGKLCNYLGDTQWLISQSTDLYNSGYNHAGAINISEFLLKYGK